MKNTKIASTAFAILAFAAGSAGATVTFSGGTTGTISELSSSTELLYSGNQSSTDLINGVTGTSVSGWNLGNGSTVPELNDGIHGVSFVDAGNSVQGTWTTVGATVTFSLGSDPLGYNITSIRSIAAWSGAGFGNQAWTLATQNVGGGSFTDRITTHFQPLGTGLAEPGATQVLLTGLNITGVQAVRLTANSVNGGGYGGAFVFREFDVVGAVIPEPSSSLLGALGMLALLRRRR